MTGHLFREIPRRLALYPTRRYLAHMYKWAERDLPSTAPTPVPAPALAERGSTGRPGIHPSPPGTAQHAHSPRRRTTYWRASAERMAQADAEHAIRCASYTALRSWWWWYACRSHLHEYVVGCCCSTPPTLPMPMPIRAANGAAIYRFCRHCYWSMSRPTCRAVPGQASPPHSSAPVHSAPLHDTARRPDRMRCHAMRRRSGTT